MIQIDLTGETFGKLKVLEFAGKKNGRNYWKCQCSCGKVIEASTGNLRSGRATNCGCFRIERTKLANTTHGKTNTKLYGVYKHMYRRCYKETEPAYKNYGGRGIKICEEWLNNFENFYDWAVNNGYDENLTLDRINVNGNYEPSNCRWVNQTVQQNNRTNNVRLVHNGEEHTLAQWALIIGVPYKAFHLRYKRHGNIDRIFQKEWS